MLVLPLVTWATLVMSVVTIGFLVATISSNFATAFDEVYEFEAYQSGLRFSASLISSALGMFFGGVVSVRNAEYFTKRNVGVREPEFRLPAISIGLITAPLDLALCGAGIELEWH